MKGKINCRLNITNGKENRRRFYDIFHLGTVHQYNYNREYLEYSNNRYKIKVIKSYCLIQGVKARSILKKELVLSAQI